MKKRQPTALFLALALILSLFPALPAKATPAPKEAPALLSLQAQSAGRFTKTDHVTVVIKANEAALRAKESLKEVSLFGLTIDDDFTPRRVYAQKIRESMLSSLRASGVSGDVRFQYSVLFPGLAMEMTLEEAQKAAQNPYVGEVLLSKNYHAPVDMTPKMSTSKPMVNVQEAWALSYTGRGQLIAVLDSGIDTAHQDFSNYNVQNGKHTSQAAVEQLIRLHGLAGTYKTPKVPYGYNYFDRTQNIKDTNRQTGMHGQHVAGTIAGHGTDASGRVRGIAPDAQLLAMRVFGERQAMTGSHVYAKAMEDSILLKADTINMSLGSPAGEAEEVDHLFTDAVRQCREAGILVNVAAGNEGQMAFEAANPKAGAPDYGVVGTPSVEPHVLSVASIENTHAVGLSLSVENHPEEGLGYVHAVGSPGLPRNTFFDVVDCKTGRTDDLSRTSLRGKIALVERSALPYRDIARRVEAQGAYGLLFYNNAEGGETFVRLEGLAHFNLSIGFLPRSVGQRLIAQGYRINYPGDYRKVTSPEAGRMSDFSSWGPTTTLQFKPEITAPGGRIYSTLNDNRYGIMSGTSMATPHLAGGSALVKARVEADYPSLSAKDRYDLVKSLLLSCARPHVDPDQHLYTSPRKQGAGVMDIGASLRSSAVLLAKDGTESKIALGEIAQEKPEVALRLKNLGASSLTYSAKLVVTTDDTANGRMMLRPFLIEERALPDVTVAARETKLVKTKLDLSLHREELQQKMPHGYFVEGFIVLTAKGVSAPELSIPFMGFYGDFDRVPAVDTPLHDLAEGETPLYGELPDVTGLLSTIGRGAVARVVPLGTTAQSTQEHPKADKRHLVFSPNGDDQLDFVSLRSVFTRNYSRAAITITKRDANGRDIPVYQNWIHGGRKNHYSGSLRSPKSREVAHWDGTDRSGRREADGRFTLRLDVTPTSAHPQVLTTTMPLILDTAAPELRGAKQQGTSVRIYASDPTSGIKQMYATQSGRSERIPIQGKTLDITGINPASLTIHAVDYGLNERSASLTSLLRLGEQPEDPEPSPEEPTPAPDPAPTPTPDPVVPEEPIVPDPEEPVIPDPEEPVIPDPTELGSLSVSGRTTANTTLPTFYFRVFNSNNQPVGSLTDLPFDTYRIQVTRIPEGFRVRQREITKTITPQAPHGDVVFIFEKTESSVSKAALYAAIREAQSVDLRRYQARGTRVLRSVLYRARSTYLNPDATSDQIASVIRDLRQAMANLVPLYRSMDRLHGKDRYETAAKISARYYKTSKEAFLVSGQRQADLLCAAPLAHLKDAPMLLTEGTRLPQETKKELRRLGVDHVTLIGGTKSISSATEKELWSMGLTVVRLYGADRYETSARIASEVLAHEQANKKEAVVVSGEALADGLSAAQLAAPAAMPILLTRPRSIPHATEALLAKGRLDTLTLIGGESAITPEATQLLKKHAKTSRRLFGANRYETALAIAKAAYPEGQKVFIATGETLSDALVLGAVSAKSGSALLLTPGQALPKSVQEWLKSNRPQTITLFGGQKVLSLEMEQALSTLHP
ncbi:C5a peptidase [Clostridiaceae bacterium JG1575]|nr:C5a peptidase [Clostridiaceae bacterium JG1575]